MKKTPDQDQDREQQSEASPRTVDRREFLGTSVGIGAAVLGASVIGGASKAMAQDMVIPTPDWKTLTPGAKIPTSTRNRVAITTKM